MAIATYFSIQPSALHDLKYAVRLLAKDPGFTLVAVLALALGIGMNTTVFTFVNAVLIRGLPFPDSHQLLHVDLRNTSIREEFPASWPEYEEWRTRTKTFSGLAGYRSSSMNITETSRPPERAAGLVMLAACLVPAHRATRLDPLAALRVD